MSVGTLRRPEALDQQTRPLVPPPERGFRRWVLQHDDSWWFVACYLVLAVVLSLAISLFWLVAVVAGHGVLEWLRQRWLNPRPAEQVWGRVVWELKLDLALVLFALTLAAYMDMVWGVAGLGSAARLGVHAGARIGARTTAWSRALRGVLLSLDDAAQLGRVVAGQRVSAPSQDSGVVLTVPHRPWRPPWRWSDHLSVWGGLGLLVLLLAAPWLTHHDPAALLALLGEELHPFPWWMEMRPGSP